MLKKSGLLIPILLVLFAVYLIPQFFCIISDGYVGVKYRLNSPYLPLLSPGLHVYIPGFEKIHSVRIQHRLEVFNNVDCVNIHGDRLLFPKIEVRFDVKEASVLNMLGTVSNKVNGLWAEDALRTQLKLFCHDENLSILRSLSAFERKLMSCLEYQYSTLNIDVTLLSVWASVPAVMSSTSNKRSTLLDMIRKYETTDDTVPVDSSELVATTSTSSTTTTTTATHKSSTSAASSAAAAAPPPLPPAAATTTTTATSSSSFSARAASLPSRTVPSLSRERCQKYAAVDFIPEHLVPTRINAGLLMSFAGAGNSWVRKLVEYMSGYYTGTIDPDATELKPLFPGEGQCSVQLSLIKCKPGDFYMSKYGDLFHSSKTFRRHCNRGAQKSYDRLVFISRNPFDAMLAEFQRRPPGKGWYGIVTDDTLNSENRTSFLNFVRREASLYEKYWGQFVLPMQMTMEQTFGVFRYENLLDESLRMEELRSLVSFLGYGNNTTPERLACAFVLAEHPEIHQPNRVNGIKAFTMENGLKCELWKKVQDYSSNFSYPLFEGGENC